MTERDPLSFPSPDRDDADIAARLAALYGATPDADPLAVEQCARAVRAESVRRLGRSAWNVPTKRWWWGAAAAAAVLVVLARPFKWPTVAHQADSALTQAVASATLSGTITTLDGRAVRFDLTLPTSAREVAIVGDFNGWDQAATPMARRERDGTWSANVPLAPGRHVYAFVVDGKRWIVDPLAPQVPDDGFGPANAVVIEGTAK